MPSRIHQRISKNLFGLGFYEFLAMLEGKIRENPFFKVQSGMITVYGVESLIVQVNLCQKLFFLQNMGRTGCVQKLFWTSEAISVHNMLSPGLSLEFSFIELAIQGIICVYIVS